MRITNGRSYKGGLRGDFSYRDDSRSEPNPAVWVVKSEDQPRAREILREAGLLDSTRVQTQLRAAGVPQPGRGRQRATRRSDARS